MKNNMKRKSISLEKTRYYSAISREVANLKTRSNRLALKVIKQNNEIKAVHVNKILAHTGIKITGDMLNKILTRKRLVFSNLSKDTIKTEEFVYKVGTYRGPIQIAGVYIWTHLLTNDKYVGSSSQLARRLTGYFQGTHRSVGKFIPFLKLEGLNNFQLEIIPLDIDYTQNQELALEQYFLLHEEFNLNTLKSVDGYSGSRSKTLFMYNETCTKLIYKTSVKEDFIFKLGIHHSTLTRCLKTGEIYLNKFVFTDVPHVNALETDLSIQEISELLSIERNRMINSKGRKIEIKSLNGHTVETFSTISECIKYLNNISPSNKSTLLRHIDKGIPYHGFVCTYQSDKVAPLLDKSIQVSVTHIPTNVTNYYSSLRKAALSFEPNIKTTGQTLAKFADDGKIFNDEYIIKLVNGTPNLDTKLEDKGEITDVMLYQDNISNNKKFSLINVLLFFILILSGFSYIFIHALNIVEDNNINDYTETKETEITDYKEEIDTIRVEQNVIHEQKEKNLLDFDENNQNDDYSSCDNAENDVTRTSNIVDDKASSTSDNLIPEQDVFNALTYLHKEIKDLKDKSEVLEDETKVLRDKSKMLKDETKMLEDESKILEDETKILKNRSKVLEDENKVLEDEYKVLKYETKMLKYAKEVAEKHIKTYEKPEASSKLKESDEQSEWEDEEE